MIGPLDKHLIPLPDPSRFVGRYEKILFWKTILTDPTKKPISLSSKIEKIKKCRKEIESLSRDVNLILKKAAYSSIFPKLKLYGSNLTAVDSSLGLILKKCLNDQVKIKHLEKAKIKHLEKQAKLIPLENQAKIKRLENQAKIKRLNIQANQIYDNYARYARLYEDAYLTGKQLTGKQFILPGDITTENQSLSNIFIHNREARQKISKITGKLKAAGEKENPFFKVEKMLDKDLELFKVYKRRKDELKCEGLKIPSQRRKVYLQ